MRLGEKRFVHQLIARFKKIGRGNVLDVGSGPGWITVAVAEGNKEWNVTGLDASPIMLEHARAHSAQKKVPVEWVQGFADKTGLPNETFSLIYSSLAFHEFPNARAALTEFLRVLKKGGTIVVSDLMRPSPIGMLYYQFISLLFTPFSAAFRKQFFHSLKSAYNLEELRAIADEMKLDYSLDTEGYFGVRLLVLTIRKA
jgi:ubiquinone/menaquinone biosynthesis C-methylase UbiE